jgi:hypothetical protein
MHADYCDLVDPWTGNHWHQHLLPEHRLRGLANSQQCTHSRKGVHWDDSVSPNGRLHPRHHLSNISKRHCRDIH